MFPFEKWHVSRKINHVSCQKQLAEFFFFFFFVKLTLIPLNPFFSFHAVKQRKLRDLTVVLQRLRMQAVSNELLKGH